MIGVSDSSDPSPRDLHPARPCVYLDQWVWIRLARAANGETFRRLWDFARTLRAAHDEGIDFVRDMIDATASSMAKASSGEPQPGLGFLADGRHSALRLAETRWVLSIRPVSPDEATPLDISAGPPMIVLFRTYLDSAGLPMRVFERRERPHPRHAADPVRGRGRLAIQPVDNEPAPSHQGMHRIADMGAVCGASARRFSSTDSAGKREAALAGSVEAITLRDRRDGIDALGAIG
jgi:hypothetical protein